VCFNPGSDYLVGMNKKVKPQKVIQIDKIVRTPSTAKGSHQFPKREKLSKERTFNGLYEASPDMVISTER